MRRIVSLFLALVALGAGSSSVLAQPCVEASLTFDPDTLAAGGTSVLTASLQNTGDQGGLVSLSVTLAYNADTFGPIQASIHLNAGKQLQVQIPVHDVPRLAPGMLTLTVDAAVGDCTSHAEGSLVIQKADPPDSVPMALNELGSAILSGFSHPVSTEPVTWGSLKSRFPSP